MTDPNNPPPRNPRIRPPQGRHRSKSTGRGCLSGIVRIPAIAIKVAVACLFHAKKN